MNADEIATLRAKHDPVKRPDVHKLLDEVERLQKDVAASIRAMDNLRRYASQFVITHEALAQIADGEWPNCDQPVEVTQNIARIALSSVTTLPLCDTTKTPRKACALDCGTYAGNLGPCETWEAGSNERCAFCDHGKDCHDGRRKLNDVIAETHRLGEFGERMQRDLRSTARQMGDCVKRCEQLEKTAEDERQRRKDLGDRLVHRWTNARGHKIVQAAGRSAIKLGDGRWAGDGIEAGEYAPDEAPMFDSESAMLAWVTRGALS